MPNTKDILGSCVQKLPTVRKNGAVSTAFSLYEGERYFTDREDVRQHLPDILGKALARTWIDTEFHKAFDQDPVGTSKPMVCLFPAQ